MYVAIQLGIAILYFTTQFNHPRGYVGQPYMDVISLNMALEILERYIGICMYIHVSCVSVYVSLCIVYSYTMCMCMCICSQLAIYNLVCTVYSYIAMCIHSSISSEILFMLPIHVQCPPDQSQKDGAYCANAMVKNHIRYLNLACQQEFIISYIYYELLMLGSYVLSQLTIQLCLAIIIKLYIASYMTALQDFCFGGIYQDQNVICNASFAPKGM